jgi:hypothetical protein
MSEQHEDQTLFLVTESHEYSGYNGWEWSDEDVENVAWRGYFLTREDAETWIEDQKQRLIAEGRARNDADLARVNAEAEQRHHENTAHDEVKRTEYDALVAAGITPSFDRPGDRGPFQPRASKFDEQKYLAGQRVRWEVVEIDAHVKAAAS